MLAFSFAHCYYKSGNIGDVYRPYWINIFGLKFTNKRSNGKEKDLAGASSKKFMILLNNRPGVILISLSQLRLINKVFWNNL